MQDLLKHENVDVRAAEAVALFCYQVKKWIGGFAAALGGVDTFVFAGGIGENAPVIRARICDGLGFLGIELEEKRNLANAAVISTEAGRVTVRVMHTDEEWMIAKTVCRVLGLGLASEKGSSERELFPRRNTLRQRNIRIGNYADRCETDFSKKEQITTMLNKVKTLTGYKLNSRDSEIGKVKEFYFDDHFWTICYLVAETGDWLTGRQVLISPYGLGFVNKRRAGASPSI